jgi:DNA polymerase-3 subunit delta
MAESTNFRLAIFYGDDGFAIDQAINELGKGIAKALKNKDAAEMNILHVDAGSAKFQEIESAIMVISFFSQGHRLVILENLVKNRQIKEKNFQKKLLAMFNNIPETTQVIIPIHDALISKSRGWETYKKSFFLRKWADKEGHPITFSKEYQLPSDREMPRWIQDHAKAMKGKFDPHAAASLASLIGNDTAIAHQEILKCLTYVNFSRAVEEMDVHQLVSYGGVANIFDMVDAMAQGQARKAQKLYHRLLEESLPQEIFAMVIRQFRLLIQAREVIDQGGRQQDVANRTGQHPYVAGKIEAQARRFTMHELEAIYRRLLEIDYESKSSGMPLNTSIDVLIYDLAR